MAEKAEDLKKAIQEVERHKKELEDNLAERRKRLKEAIETQTTLQNQIRKLETELKEAITSFRKLK